LHNLSGIDKKFKMTQVKLKSVLVTGGAGFIGSHLVEKLVARGAKVTVLDNFSTGKKENLSQFKNKIELIKGSITNKKIVKKCVANVDVVFHLAAIPSVPRSFQFPIETTKVNLDGTLNILEEASNAKVKRLIFASSSSVYGDSPVLPKYEELPPNPLSPYATSKLGGELYCKIFSKMGKIETVSLRFFNVYGPRQDPNSQYAAVIPNFIKKLLQGEKPVIFGSGEQTRSFTYVSDVVDAMVLAAGKEGINGEVINIASRERISINDLLDIVATRVKIKIIPQYLPPRKGDILHSYGEIKKAEKILNFRPSITLEEGIKMVVRQYKS